MPYDPQKHDRRSIRLPEHDYSSPGAYFVTLNVKGRYPLFGEVTAGRMHLSALGRIAQAWWEKLPARYERAALDAYVVMPDHLHGILRLLPYEDGDASPDRAEASGNTSDHSSSRGDDGVRAIHESPRQQQPPRPPQQSQPPPRQQHQRPSSRGRSSPRQQQPDLLHRRRMLLSKMIGYYKMNTAKRINQRRATPGTAVWQRDYYEHIVRNRPALRRIRRYILQNPAQWHRGRSRPGRS